MKQNQLIKMLIVVGIILILLIPREMIKQMIHERQITHQEAVSEISSKWSNKQTLSGPLLSIPYSYYVKSKSGDEEKMVEVKDRINLLPANLDVKNQLNSEIRYRGIHEVVVYNSVNRMDGYFDLSEVDKLNIPDKDIHYELATLNIGISDLRGLQNQVQFRINGKDYHFNPGTDSKLAIPSGIKTQVNLRTIKSSGIKFSSVIDLKGSEEILFTPVGKETNISMQSEWTDPSFDGAFLPDKRNVSKDGFTAEWKVLHLNRSFPQAWKGNDYSFGKSTFGVKLLLPVDNYLKSIRAIKYALLVIALTFIAFFFVEIMKKQYLHPIQYGLIGIALIVFFSLLVAISEHSSFNFAYLISAFATTALISVYTWAVTKSTGISAIIAGILVLLYGFIFFILQLQDYALLFGNIGLFIILGVIMYFSRKIDWYNLSTNKKGRNDLEK